MYSADEWEIVDNSPSYSSDEWEEIPNTSLFDAVGSRVALTVPSIKETAGNLLRFREEPNPFFQGVRDFTPNIPVIGPGLSLFANTFLPSASGTGTNYGEGITRSAQKQIEQVREQYPLEPGISTDAIESIPTALKTIPSLVLGFAPLQFGADTLAATYGRNRDRGYSPEEATVSSIAPTTFAAAGGHVFPKILAGGNILTRPAQTFVSAATFAPALEATNILGEVMAKDEVPSTPEIGSRVAEAFKSGIGPAALFAAGSVAAPVFTRPRTKTEGPKTTREDIREKMNRVAEEPIAPLQLPAGEIRPGLFHEVPRALPPPEGVFTQGENPGALLPPTAESVTPLIREPLPSKIGKEVIEVTPETKPESTIPVAKKPIQEIAREKIAAEAELPLAAKTEQEVFNNFDEFQIYKIPTKAIAARPELTQFKSGADLTSGVTESGKIESKYDNRLAGTIVVWEPKAESRKDYTLEEGQKYLISEGHHRHDLAIRDKIESQNGFVLREEDGWSLEDAVALSSEINIVQDRGTIYDQVKFLRNKAAARGKDAAVARAREIGIDKRAASTIAFDASPSLYTAFINERVSPEQAATISRVAGGDAVLQDAALEAVVKTPNATVGQVENEIRLARISRDFAVPDSQQLSFAGIEASADVARQQHQARMDIVDAWQKYYKHREESVRGSLKNPEASAAMGHPVLDPAKVQAEFERVSGERARWKEFDIHPDLVQVVRAQTRPEDVISPKKVADKAVEGLFDKIFQAIDDERGSTGQFFETLEKLLPEMIKRQKLDPRVKQKKLDPSQAFFEGLFPGQNPVPFVSKALAGYRKLMIFPSTVVTKFPESKRTYDLLKEKQKDSNRVIFKLSQEAAPFFDLVDTAELAKVNAVLAEMRHKGAAEFPPTRENLFRVGLSPEGVEAVLAVRKSLDTALQVIEDSLIKSISHLPPEQQLAKRAKIAKQIQGMKDENYVPFGRFGDYFLNVKTPEGQSFHLSFHPNKASAVKDANKFAKEGFKAEMGPIPKGKLTLGDALPDNVKKSLEGVDAEGFSPRAEILGFSKHYQKAALVDGYEKNMKRNLAEYFTSLGPYAARLRWNGEINAEINKLDPSGQRELKSYWSELANYTDKVGGEAAAFRQMIAINYLAGVVKSGAVNLTQPLMTTYPVLANYTKSPEKVFARSVNLSAHYLFNRELFKKQHPELHRGMEQALKDGEISADKVREMLAMKNGNFSYDFISKASDAAMLTFTIPEKMNRHLSFIAGWEVAPNKDFTERVKFAEDFANTTQFDMSRLDRPRAARGPIGGPLSTFRLYQGHMLRLLRNHTSIEKSPVLLRMLLSLLALGGLTALPFVKGLDNSLTSSGLNLKGDLRKKVDDGELPEPLADFLIAGIPALMGLSISGAISSFDMSKELSANPYAAFGQFIGGPAGDLVIGKPSRMYYAATEALPDQRNYRIAEAAAPEAIRHAMVAERARRENAFQAVNGTTVLDNPSTGQLLAKGFGFTPYPLAKQYEYQQGLKALQDKMASINHNVNRDLARALETNNTEEVSRIIKEIRENNERYKDQPAFQMSPDKNAIKMAQLKLRNPRAWEVMRTKKEGRALILELQNRYKDK